MNQPKNTGGHNPDHEILAVRLDPGVRQDIRALLADHGWTVREFVTACAALLLANPDAYLARLEHFRTRRRRGRPAQG